jgi:uncharacterized protein (DUF952 family)
VQRQLALQGVEPNWLTRSVRFEPDRRGRPGEAAGLRHRPADRRDGGGRPAARAGRPGQSVQRQLALQGVEPNWLTRSVRFEPQRGQATARFAGSAPTICDETGT